jgi:hypothetical protein
LSLVSGSRILVGERIEGERREKDWTGSERKENAFREIVWHSAAQWIIDVYKLLIPACVATGATNNL